MSWCSVKGCSSGSKRKEFRDVDRSHIRFHRFPHDTQYQQKWLDATGNPNLKVKNGMF